MYVRIIMRILLIVILLIFCASKCVTDSTCNVIVTNGTKKDCEYDNGDYKYDHDHCKCEHSNLTCNSLKSALELIHHCHDIDVLNITIQSNIKLNDSINQKCGHPVNITGVNNPTIDCNNNSVHLRGNYDGDNDEDDKNLTIRHIHWRNCKGPIGSVHKHNCKGEFHNDSTNNGILFECFNEVNIDSVTFTNTTGMSILHYGKTIIKNAIFQDNEFVNTMLHISTTTKYSSEVIIENTWFCNNIIETRTRKSGLVRIVTFDEDNHLSQLKEENKLSSIKIRNSHFLNNHFLNDSSSLEIHIINKLITLLIHNCRFENITSRYNISIIRFEGSHIENGTLEFSNNHFLNNDGGVVEIKLREVSNGNITVIETGSVYKDNKGYLVHILHNGIRDTNITHTFDNISISNNNPGMSGTYRPVSIMCSECDRKLTVHLTGTNIIGNTAPTHNMWPEAVVYLHNVNTTIENSTFSFNTGTSLQLNNTTAYLGQDVLFNSNNAFTGAAITVYGSSTLNFDNQTNISFLNNHAVYGGALYVNNASALQLCTRVTFTNNKASSGGSDIYFENPHQATEFNNTNCNDTLAVGTPAYHITSYENAVPIFPGQNIPLHLTVVDFNGHPSYCEATVLFKCDYKLCDERCIWHHGQSVISLSTRRFITNIYITSPKPPVHCAQLVMQLVCKYSNISIDLTITECPDGFKYNDTTMMCECLEKGDIKCSNMLGQACIPKDRWVIEDDDNILLAECNSPFCNTMVQTPCSQEIADNMSYVVIQSQRCKEKHGGLACINCDEYSNYTFLALKCVSDDGCRPWQPGLVLFFAIVFQIILTSLILLLGTFIIKNVPNGMFGFLFYFAILSNLPFNYFDQYISLENLVSLTGSFLFLNWELFGLIPVCAFQTIGPLSNFGLRFVGPIIALIIAIILSLISRLIPKYRTNSTTFIMNINLIFFLLLWSLASTSINIMYSLKLNIDGIENTRVYLQPDLTYFTGSHVPLWLCSFGILVFIISPFLLLITFSRLISYKFKLVRFKPFLEFYQACYSDRYHWFSAVYCIAFIIFLSAKTSFLVQMMTLITVTTLVTSLKPYRSKWTNISDTFLVLNLVFIYALLYQQVTAQKLDNASTAFVYISIIAVYIYMIARGLYVLLYELGLLKRLIYKYNLNRFRVFNSDLYLDSEIEVRDKEDDEISNASVTMIDAATTGYREPLLDLVQSNNSIRYGIQQT